MSAEWQISHPALGNDIFQQSFENFWERRFYHYIQVLNIFQGIKLDEFPFQS